MLAATPHSIFSVLASTTLGVGGIRTDALRGPGTRRQWTLRLPPGRGGLYRRRRHPARSWLVRTLALAFVWAATQAAAQPTVAQPPAAGAAVGAEPPVVIQGPPPPEPPAVFTRDAAGRMTIRAIRLAAPLDIDGTLDEPLYRDVPGLTDFVQIEPIEGAPATERTEVWLAFDDDNVYIAGRCWDSAPESRWIANELRRDSFNIAQNEYIDIVLDTFYDRRNGINLTVNPLGGRMDGQITDERDYAADWNPVWSVRAGRFPGGWTFESAIPFKSLRYRPGRAQVWGFSLTRRVRWKNELSSLVPLPISRGIMLISQAATVVGIEAPDGGGRVLEIKPYAIGDLTTDRGAAPALANALHAEAGLDVKYALTENLVADATVNTDFAQVEVDEQQVNLTRFRPVLSREARVLPGEPGGVRVRRSGRQPVRGCRPQRADPVLQPPHRPGGARRRHGRGADGGGRPADRPGRPVQRWRAAHPDRERAPDRHGGHGLLGGAHQARRAAPQQHRGPGGAPLGLAPGPGGERHVRRGRNVLVLRRPEHQYLLGAHRHRRDAGRPQLPGAVGLCRRPLRRAARAARGRARIQPGDRVPAAGRLRGQLRRPALQPRGRRRSRPSGN